MSSSVLISIPLCTYNGARFLSAQLDSLLQQTHEQIEILIFDDASTDDTWQILQAYAQRDQRIRLFLNQSNVGFARNFQQALAACTGEFIAPCDQDDVWLPEKLSQLLSCIGERSMVFCDSLLIDAEGRSLHTRVSDLIVMRDIDDPLMLVFSNCASGHASLFRCELLERALPMPDDYFYDHWLALVAASTTGLSYCNQVLVHYRQHDRNVSDITGERERSKSRPAGYRLLYWRKCMRQLAAVANLPGGHQYSAAVLARELSRRETALCCPYLCYLLWKLNSRLYALDRRTYWARLGIVKRMFVGIPVKRLFRPYPYTLSDH